MVRVCACVIKTYSNKVFFIPEWSDVLALRAGEFHMTQNANS